MICLEWNDWLIDNQIIEFVSSVTYSIVTKINVLLYQSNCHIINRITGSACFDKCDVCLPAELTSRNG